MEQIQEATRCVAVRLTGSDYRRVLKKSIELGTNKNDFLQLAIMSFIEYGDASEIGQKVTILGNECENLRSENLQLKTQLKSADSRNKIDKEQLTTKEKKLGNEIERLKEYAKHYKDAIEQCQKHAKRIGEINEDFFSPNKEIGILVEAIKKLTIWK